MRPFSCTGWANGEHCAGRMRGKQMKKSLKLLGCLWLVCLGAMLPCAGDEAFAGDNNQPLTCTAYTSADDTDTLRRRMLLGSGTGTRKTHTYYGSSSSNSGNSNTTMIFVGDPQDIIVDSAKVVMRLHWSRIDEPDFVPPSTTPAVSFNGVSIGHMTKLNSKTQNDEFIINPSLIKFNDYNTLWHETSVNNPGSGSWASVTVEGVAKSIDLSASSNLDDSIKLSWNTSSGMSGARYYIDRRRYPTEQFKCLNKDDPIRERQYVDRNCLPGVNYYYRVRSESGIESEQVVGKRVAKTTEPRFEFTLTGTDFPIYKGALGRYGENDVLVAGHAFNLNVSSIDVTQNVAIKKIELIGMPIGGAKSQRNEHRKIWYSDDTEVSPSARLFLGNPFFPANSCAVGLNASLKAGKGYHGKYKWSVECEYELDGKKGKCNAFFNSNSSAYFEKRVYFEKYGTDNGEHAKKDFDGIKYCEYVPNWFAYWRDDGACPGLKDDRVFYSGQRAVYREKGEKGPIYGGAANSYVEFDGDRRVCLNGNAADLWCPAYKIPITICNKKFMTWDGNRRVYGIYKVEDTIAHEWQHHETMKRYIFQTKVNHEIDSDSHPGFCVIETGMTTKCKNVKEESRISDCIVDIDEMNLNSSVGVVQCAV